MIFDLKIMGGFMTDMANGEFVGPDPIHGDLTINWKAQTQLILR
jgi:hypothetical protein